MKRILHIFPPSTFLKPYLELINSNFEAENHIFVVPGYNAKGDDFSDYNNVLCINKDNRFSGWRRLASLILNSEKTIIHGFTDPRLMLLLDFLVFFNRGLRKKLYWYIWGGDIYFHVFRKKNLKDTSLELLKKSAIKKIGNVVTGSKYPYDLLKEWYKVSPKSYTGFYPDTTDMKEMELEISQNKESKLVLLGNSASDTNEHIEAIDRLKELRKTNEFKVVCPLSYGDKDYAKKIAAYGEKKLGNDFIPLFDFMAPKDYLKLLSTVDVAIMNHRRQQAFGNIRMLLYLGKKVYIRKEAYTFDFLTDIGVKIFDAGRLMTGLDEKFMDFEQSTGKSNSMIIGDYYSKENCKKKWQEIFES